MKKKNIIITLFPALVMAIISIMTSTNMFSLSDLEAKSLIIDGLVIIFPVVFILQGVSCAITHTNVILSLSVSIITYLVIMFVFLNSSAFIYVFVYVFIWTIGYWITRCLIKSKSPKGN
ncbi:hypothetical protein PGLA_11910 [Paenibacillus glacialis]|uniref:Uncharacterized protein n=1 Tax=Paenibacillus glacialis TaxID=494026 RepID=A0A168KRP1_9BACL|nr:hypothetical protein PGLA_11910 [Paenibacillus glacialis]